MMLDYKGETFDLSFDINMFEIFRKFFINLKNNRRENINSISQIFL